MAHTPGQPPGSNTGPFGIPPGGPWFADASTGLIQRQSNPALAEALVQSGQFVGFPTKAAAQAFLKNNPVRKVTHAVGAPTLGGIQAIGDLAARLTEGNTWIRIGEFVAGAILIYVGFKAMFPEVVNSVTAPAKTAAMGAMFL
jgi:hypothetical protein